ncbi:hypothetical protein A3L11_04635 [Thermococcus siculi]|uniref:Uncharacterized protein n=1 Tax=Thermococcus siculi TaxID=72803 RepID=A0A2Z2MRZ4_9EURY|nr:hypothetical protein [Thermococcus siculi]ASJ08556.1 hypothetical protein A3L11_04635 [Thermococcus siculi]
MDELEFCVKSLTYPLGMLLEGKERRAGNTVRITRDAITLPRIPFAALCYLTGIALFDSLDLVDKKRLGNDYDSLETFRGKLLNSKLGEALRPYLESPGRHVSPGDRLAVDWLEFERRAEKVRPYLERVLELHTSATSRADFLEKAGFLGELTVDEGLLLGYLTEDGKLRELINAALGKHNPDFKAMVVKYFKALRG